MLVAVFAAPALAQGTLTATMAFAPSTIPSGGPTEIVVALGNASGGGAVSGIEFDVVFPAVMHRWGTPTLAQCEGVVDESATGFRFRNGSVGPSSTCTVRFPVTVEQDDDGDVRLAIDAIRSANGGTVTGLSALVHVIGGIPPSITSPPPPSRGYLGLEYKHVVTVTGTMPITVDSRLRNQRESSAEAGTMPLQLTAKPISTPMQA